jgi:hypothetical protein
VQWKRVAIKSFWLALWLTVWLFILFVGFWLIQRNLAELLTSGFWEWLQTALGVTTAGAALWALLRVAVDLLGRGARAVLGFNVALYPNLFRPTLMEETAFPFETFHQDLSDLIKAIRRPVVVLIDDLDRCPVDQIVPVLEAVKYFDISPPPQKKTKPGNGFASIAFVLAADRRAIDRAVRAHFKDYMEEMTEPERDVFAREYIEKIIQVPFELPPIASMKLGEFLDIRTGFSQLQLDNNR